LDTRITVLGFFPAFKDFFLDFRDLVDLLGIVFQAFGESVQTG
jgi:hypothetical protein